MYANIQKLQKKNKKEGCIRAKECIWSGTVCDKISSFREECSKSIDDVNYSGTLDRTCDGMPCLNWEYVYRYFDFGLRIDEFIHDVSFQMGFDSIRSSSNYCRENKYHGYAFDGAWCYVNTTIYGNSTTSSKSKTLSMKPCCGPLCNSEDEVKSKCVLTERGRYEYAGNQNMSCQKKPCMKFPKGASTYYVTLHYGGGGPAPLSPKRHLGRGVDQCVT